MQVLRAIRPGEQVKADDIMARLSLDRPAAGQALCALWNSQHLERVSRGVFRRCEAAPPLVGYLKIGRPRNGEAPTVLEVSEL